MTDQHNSDYEDGQVCGLCKHEPVIAHATPPIGSLNSQHPLPLGKQCDARLTVALSDLPWLRFVLSRYVPPTVGLGPLSQAPRWEWLNR